MQLFLAAWGGPSTLSSGLTAASLLVVLVPTDTTMSWRQYTFSGVRIGCNSHTVIVIYISPVQKMSLCPSKSTVQKANAHLGHRTRVHTVVVSHSHVALAGMLSCVFLTGNKHTIFPKVFCFVSVRHKAWRQQWAKCLLLLFPCVSPLLCFATLSSLFLERYIFDRNNLLSPLFILSGFE